MRRMMAVLWSVWAVGLGAVATPASAQDRQGFWIGAGGGFGSAGVSCDDCGASDREGSGVGYLKAGWTLGPRVLLGGELNLWSKTQRVEEGTELTVDLYNASVTLTAYPAAGRGFFVKGGAGASFVDTEIKAGGSSLTASLGTGLGLTGGAGYDIRVSRRVSVTPAVNVWYGRPGDLKILGETFASKWRHNVVDFTVGITFH
jgi:hypothetical protein